jgi:hypothetical protein
MSTDQLRVPVEQRRPKPAVASGGSSVTFRAVALVIAIAALALFFWRTRERSVKFPTNYQAVLLGNGAVYYGNLQGYGTKTPVLTNVFYVVSSTDPNTKQTSNVLVKRGKELHGPDRMYLSPNSIVFVETVTLGSKVEQLIEQANQQH